MKRLLASVAVILLGIVGSAHAQPYIRLQPSFKTGTIAANGQSVVLTVGSETGTTQNIGSFGSVKVQTLDSYSGTWEVQCSLNGTDFDADNELSLMLVDDATIVYAVSDTIGIWDVPGAAGCRAIRVIATAGFAASDTVVILSATQTGGGVGGGGTGGDVTIGDIAVQTNEDTVLVDEDDSLQLVSHSSHRCPQYVNTRIGKPLLVAPLGGVGCPKVGYTITSPGLTGDTGTILGISGQLSQIPLDGSTTGSTTATVASITNIPTIHCNRITAYMWVVATAPSAAFPAADYTYTTGPCAGGTVATSLAAATTASLTNLVFTPAILASVNADEDNLEHTVTPDFVSAIFSEPLTLTVNYSIRDSDSVAIDSFAEASVTSDYLRNTEPSDALIAGNLRGAVSVTDGAPDAGAVYVRVELIRNGSVFGTLACGTVTVTQALSFPGVCTPPEQISRVRTFSQPRPGAGGLVYLDVPSNVSHELNAVSILALPSATAGLRLPYLRFTNQEGVSTYLVSFGGQSSIAPSEQIFLTAAQGSDGNADQLTAGQLVVGRNFSGYHEPAAGELAQVTVAAPGASMRLMVQCITANIRNSGSAGSGGVLFSLVYETGGAGSTAYAWLMTVEASAHRSYVHTICPPTPWAVPTNTAVSFESSDPADATVEVVAAIMGYTQVSGVATQLHGLIPDGAAARIGPGGRFEISISADAVEDDILSEPQWKVIERWSF